MIGLGLPGLLQVDLPLESSHWRAGEITHFIVQYGGASHIDSLDLKPDAPPEIRGPYNPIATRVPGIRICELMPRSAEVADRFCIVAR